MFTISPIAEEAFAFGFDFATADFLLEDAAALFLGADFAGAAVKVFSLALCALHPLRVYILDVPGAGAGAVVVRLLREDPRGNGNSSSRR